MMDKINKIEAVTERDIDLLLLEELNVSQDFAAWFCCKVTVHNDQPLSKGAWHSISDGALGESDLITMFENGFAILIENKIDAPAQPEQGQRYQARGERGIQIGWWSSFATCMVAPNLYLEKERDARIYDANVSYEEIAHWFASKESVDRRAAYKRYLIEEAVAQNRRGYTATPDEKVSAFWSQYWELAQQQFPELEMKKPGLKPSNSDWPVFRPAVLDKRFSIVHKLERGDVDLQLSGAADKLDLLRNLLSDSVLAEAGKSAAIRLKVDSIDRFVSFESQKDKATAGLIAARKLLEIGRRLGNEL